MATTPGCQQAHIAVKYSLYSISICCQPKKHINKKALQRDASYCNLLIDTGAVTPYISYIVKITSKREMEVTKRGFVNLPKHVHHLGEIKF